MKKKKILIIAAHPDDDILGCGGYLAKYSQEQIIRVIFIAEGSSCRFSNLKENKDLIKQAIEKRTSCSVKALNEFGITDVKFFDLPCGRLDTLPILELNKIIESEIKDFSPDVVMTHSESDVNNDHKIVYKSVIMATRPGTSDSLKTILSFEILSSSEWNIDNPFTPNMFEEINKEQLNKKWSALSYFEDEIRSYPHPRSFEGIETLAKYRGMQSGTSFAESFKIIRSVKS